MTIATLEPGTRFRLACNGRPGVLLYTSPGAACVRFIDPTPRRVDIGNGRSFEVVSSTKPVTIALTTEIEA